MAAQGTPMHNAITLTGNIVRLSHIIVGTSIGATARLETISRRLFDRVALPGAAHTFAADRPVK